eukprot:gene4747-6475_t
MAQPHDRVGRNTVAIARMTPHHVNHDSAALGGVAIAMPVVVAAPAAAQVRAVPRIIIAKADNDRDMLSGGVGWGFGPGYRSPRASLIAPIVGAHDNFHGIAFFTRGSQVYVDLMRDTGKLSVEFILLVALLNAMVAMSIDTMLPAIGSIAHELGAVDPNSRQFIITTFFGGLTLGTLIYGPWSDSLGRKPTIGFGLAIY